VNDIVTELHENVQVVKNQNNSDELFKIWNIENQTNVKCAKYDCDNKVNENAYIVTKISDINKKYLIPLCKECYDLENNTKNQSIPNFTNLGSSISVKNSLLFEYIS